MYHIAKIGFQDQHLETIDQYEMGFKMMWQNVLRERNPYKQNIMIKDILLLRPYLSSYYETTKLIFFDNKNKGYDDDTVIKVNDNDEDKVEDYNDNNSNAKF